MAIIADVFLLLHYLTMAYYMQMVTNSEYLHCANSVNHLLLTVRLELAASDSQTSLGLSISSAGAAKVTYASAVAALITVIGLIILIAARNRPLVATYSGLTLVNALGAACFSFRHRLILSGRFRL